MAVVFLASIWDKATLEQYLAGRIVEKTVVYVETAADLGIEPATDEFEEVVIVLSPVSCNSTVLQAAVLETLKKTRGMRRTRLLLGDTEVPAGYGELHSLEDWRRR